MNPVLTKQQLLRWLREDDPNELEALWKWANEIRRGFVGDSVHLRGLVEISNHCTRSCLYCGLRAANKQVQRYRMSQEEIMDAARHARSFGYGTVVLQGGEDPLLTGPWVADVVRTIKQETGLAVTLSLGERSVDDLVLWRESGADRYLLRFETSNRELFDAIHPSAPGRRSDRVALLCAIQSLGYEAGGGFMVGLPGQTWESVADDLLLCARLDLDMIGIGPYLPHPNTPLGSHGRPNGIPDAAEAQVPNTALTTYKAVALARILCPEANIPSTTALATINPVNGRELGLARGGNVLMPNLTPQGWRKHYEIYPDKACIHESSLQCNHCMTGRIQLLGRCIGKGQGGRNHRDTR